jgi:hypothetical protein
VVVQVPAQELTEHRSAGDQWEPVLERAEEEAQASDTVEGEGEVAEAEQVREQVYR